MMRFTSRWLATIGFGVFAGRKARTTNPLKSRKALLGDRRNVGRSRRAFNPLTPRALRRPPDVRDRGRIGRSQLHFAADERGQRRAAAL